MSASGPQDNTEGGSPFFFNNLKALYQTNLSHQYKLTIFIGDENLGEDLFI